MGKRLGPLLVALTFLSLLCYLTPPFTLQLPHSDLNDLPKEVTTPQDKTEPATTTPDPHKSTDSGQDWLDTGQTEGSGSEVNSLGSLLQIATEKLLGLISKTPLTPEEVAQLKAQALQRQRAQILEDTPSLNKSLLMEEGGSPLRNLIFTTWRSGSTFLGEAVAAHPSVFYHYEPLLHFDIVQVRSGPLAQEGLRVLQSLLNCSYSDLQEYLDYGAEHPWLHSHNTRLWKWCTSNKKWTRDPHFLEEMCRLFPYQVMKTVRLRLRLAQTLLEIEELDIRLLYLVRDPRGTVQSRKHRDWCPPSPDCSDYTILCKDLEDDYHAAVELRRKYPNRIMIIRYEDLSLSPVEGVKSILSFFRLSYHPLVSEFVVSHTLESTGGVSSTYRDSKTTPFLWLEEFLSSEGGLEELREIQESCGRAMSLWGYATFDPQSNIAEFNPLLHNPFLISHSPMV